MNEEEIVILFYWLLILGILLLVLGAGAYLSDKLCGEKGKKIMRWMGCLLYTSISTVSTQGSVWCSQTSLTSSRVKGCLLYTSRCV